MENMGGGNMKAYQGVMHFIRRFEKKYNRYVIVKDYSGYMEQDTDLSKVFSNHFIHDSSFCMKIKEEEQNWNKCYDQKRKIYNKLSHTHEGFCGHCHAGVKEYVYPLYYYDDTEDVLIGSINIGPMSSGTLYEEEDFLEQVALMSELISGMLSEYKTLYKHETLNKQAYTRYTIQHAILFMDKNYRHDIRLKDIAQFCHCSQSLLSHNFKKEQQLSIREYMNMKRIELSKELLKDTELTITYIAMYVGYKDSNYYSKVFGDYVGMPPTAYRKSVKAPESKAHDNRRNK